MPNSFWSYEETLDLAGLRSTNPPLGLITVAAMLPKGLCCKNLVRTEYPHLIEAGYAAIPKIFDTNSTGSVAKNLKNAISSAEIYVLQLH
jgi:hypothetical protein